MTGGAQQSARHGRDITSEALLGQVRELALELHPARNKTLRVTLDSALDRELGLDSMSRVELLLRLERAFGVTLPEQVMARAETPRDLLRALLSAGPGAVVAAKKIEFASELEELEDVPHAAATLPEMLDWHVQRHPQRPHVYLYGEGDEPEVITYESLHDGARAVAAGLQSWGTLPGQSVAIMLPTSRDYLFSFFGILLAGAIPVPIYPPLRPSQLEEHLHRHARILANAQAVLLITVEEAQRVGRLLSAQVESLRDVLTTRQLVAPPETLASQAIGPQDTAFLQYTSGSTGQPKGVILTHANLLANIRAMGEAVQADSTDVFVSWLPLYHDMGLIGAWLDSVYYGLPLVLMSPLTFLSRPARWLWAIHRHRGTLTAAPNFAYELCLNKIDESDLAGLDLSSLRLAFSGAEPVSPSTLRRFCERFDDYGFRLEAMAPVYGLAEAAVGLTFPPLGRGPLIDHIQREPFSTTGKAMPAAATDAHALKFVACGRPLPGYQVRVVDDAGRELPDREEGRLEFQGPSATTGYLRNAQATQKLFQGAWLDTGDLAYIAEGDVYITSRVKDLIIRGGRNFYPYELEEAVGDLAGIRKGCVAVFGSADPAYGTERLIVVAETREEDAVARESLREKVFALASDLMGMPPDEVILLSPHTVLKTSSGKIRRAAMREAFEQGHLERRPRSVWLQIARVFIASWQPRLRGVWRHLTSLAFAAYAKVIFWLLAPVAWMIVALLPRARWRWAVLRRMARLLFRLVRVPLRVEGLEHWKRDRLCVVVANHASYLDGVVLVAALPDNIAFVAKAELTRKFIPSHFLRRIGAVFVERFDKQQGLADARRAARQLTEGRSILFFPEGTLTRMPGLLPFHLGAFVAAAESGVPVIPVTIRGTRSVLRAGSWFPRRGNILVSIAPPLFPGGSDWAEAVKLRDTARAAVLARLGEPDLEQQTPRV